MSTKWLGTLTPQRRHFNIAPDESLRSPVVIGTLAVSVIVPNP
jgi:hypothetical protein